ncbi:uncharacterized protein METZ01_LOCUS256634, partial [marine metagenome]
LRFAHTRSENGILPHHQGDLRTDWVSRLGSLPSLGPWSLGNGVSRRDDRRSLVALGQETRGDFPYM